MLCTQSKTMITFDPSEISNWASLPDAHHKLPELIRRLILATVPVLSRLDMPSGSAVWQPGWDGLLTTDIGNAWAPSGASAWELSCEGNPGPKAGGDYRKRTKEPESIRIATTTFVFVTPRLWSGKDRWVKQRRAKDEWANVRGFDSRDIALWLEQAPAVAEWFARLIGKLPADGYTALNDWWENWATHSQPDISPALVLAGRPESTARLAEWFQQTPNHYYVQAQTREEAIAFVAASALNSDDAWGAALLSKALVVKSEDAWHSLVRHTFPLVLIRDFDGSASPSVAVNRGHHVITPLHDNDDPKGNGVKLPQLDRDETITALTEMGLSTAEARALVRKTARRLPIMRRSLIDEAGGPIPQWASVATHSALPSLILIGQWDESNEHDQAIVAELTGRTYEEVTREATVLTQTEDSPLTKMGNTWRFLSHEEAWHLLAPRLTTAEVERFREWAVTILAAESPEFEMPIDERFMANIYDKVVPHSETLRAGIARTLALMGSQGERAKNVTVASDLPELILRRVLAGNAGWQIWATLDRNLPTLAEAAPAAILSAIEQGLAKTPSPFAALFAQEGDPVFGGSAHTGLLWALERLAWAPEHFARVATVLARLASNDPGGRIVNRPAASLAEMFLPWLRVSETPDTRRLETLGMLLNKYPEPSWQMLVKAYPSLFATSIEREPPSCPQGRQDGATRPTWAEFDAFVAGMEQLLIEHVGDDPGRWEDIVDMMSRLSPDALRKATDLMAQQIDAIIQQPGSTKLWTKLRKELNRHRSLPDAEWAMPAADLEPLDAIYQQLTPDDPATACGWLFDGWPEPPEGTDHNDIAAHSTKIDADRRAAITTAYASGGTEAVLSIAESAQQPEQVGQIFTDRIGTEPALALVIAHSGSGNRNYRTLARGILHTIFNQSGWAMLDDALAQLKATVASPQALADVFLAATATPDTWRRLAQEEPAVQRCYWEQLDPYLASRADQTEMRFVAEQLLAVQRSPMVAEWIAYKPVHHEIVIQTLEQLPTDLAAGTTSEPDTSGIIYNAIVEMLKKLDESNAVDDDTIACLELPFMSILPHNGRPNLALYRKIAKDPALFADLIALAYKRSDGQTDNVANEQKLHTSAEILTQIIVGEGEVPGKIGDGTVDYESLSTWVKEAQRLCTERGRSVIGDIYIGRLLAKAPAGADGIWPCEPVRELLDGIDSQHIGNGFVTGTRSLRGVTTRGVFDGGDQELTLVDEYNKQADVIASRWPNTAGLLRRIADSYHREAQWNDQEATELDQFGS